MRANVRADLLTVASRFAYCGLPGHRDLAGHGLVYVDLQRFFPGDYPPGAALVGDMPRACTALTVDGTEVMYLISTIYSGCTIALSVLKLWTYSEQALHLL